MSTAAQPATLRAWNPAKDRTAVAKARRAAASVPKNASGRAVPTARRPTARVATISEPFSPALATTSTSPRTASDDPRITRALGVAVDDPAFSAQPPNQLPTPLTPPLLSRYQAPGVPLGRDFGLSGRHS